MIHIQGDVDIPQIMRMFEGGLLDDAIRAAEAPSAPCARRRRNVRRRREPRREVVIPLHVARHSSLRRRAVPERDANVGAEGHTPCPIARREG